MGNDYNSLDLDHKREFLMNTAALMLLADNLATEYKCSIETLTNEVWQSAYDQIADLSPDEVNQLVADLEAKHRPFNSQGAVILSSRQKPTINRSNHNDRS